MPIRPRYLPLLLLVSFAVQAKMYRWTDENGQTVYSQMPPPDGKAVEIAPPPPPPPPSAPVSTPPPADKKTATGQPRADERKPSEVPEDSEIRARNCAAARHNLRVYEGLGSRLLKKADGTIYRPTEE